MEENRNAERKTKERKGRKERKEQDDQKGKPEQREKKKDFLFQHSKGNVLETQETDVLPKILTASIDSANKQTNIFAL